RATRSCRRRWACNHRNRRPRPIGPRLVAAFNLAGESPKMAEPATAAPRASLSTLDAAAMLVGIVIGIGIFKTPSLVANFVPNETFFIGMWLLGGFVTFVGALCYAELGSSRPSAGGEYQFLKEAYGPKVSVLFAWA